jgi:hypothetical protein
LLIQISGIEGIRSLLWHISGKVSIEQWTIAGFQISGFAQRLWLW